MRLVPGLLATFFLLLVVTPTRADTFPRPASLEPNVRFWRSVFADYSRLQVVVHDTWDLDKVYSVLDFRVVRLPGPDRARPADQGRHRRRGGAHPRDLREARRGRPEADGSHPRRAARLRHVPGRSDPDQVPGRRRSQAPPHPAGPAREVRRGPPHRASLPPEMERIFREEGLPTELTRLPLVESCFDVEAYSKVGAAGIWQFMPATGRIYSMDVNDIVDERRDPIASTRGRRALPPPQLREPRRPVAARDHGLQPRACRHPARDRGHRQRPTSASSCSATGATRSASRRGTSTPSSWPRSTSTSTASTYFGKLEGTSAEPTRVVPLERPLGIEVAAKLAGCERETVASLNPALMDCVVDGRRHIPAG